MKKGLFVLLLIASFATPAFSESTCPTDGLGNNKAKKTANATNQEKDATANDQGKKEVSSKNDSHNPGCL